MSQVKTIGLQQLQIGTETTWGTSVAPTAILNGIQTVSLNPLTETRGYESLQGNAPNYDVGVVTTGAEGSIESLTLYEDLPYWLDSLIETVTPTGAGPYTYSYLPPLNSCPTRTSYTLVYGDDDNAYGMEGSVVNSLTLGFTSGEEVTADLELIGEAIEVDALETLSTRSTTIAVSAEASVYIDDWGTSFGVTAIPCTVFSAELELNSNTTLQYRLGSIVPCDYAQDRWEATLSMTMEFADGNIANTILDASIGATPTLTRRLIRVEAVSGTNSITIDFAAFLEESPEIYTDEDGVTTLEFSWNGLFSPVISNFLQIDVVNSVASLP